MHAPNDGGWIPFFAAVDCAGDGLGDDSPDDREREIADLRRYARGSFRALDKNGGGHVTRAELVYHKSMDLSMAASSSAATPAACWR